MTENTKTVSLPEEDYLAILNILQALNNCHTRKDFWECIQKEILPLFKAQASIYAWLDPDVRSPQVIDSVGFPEKEHEGIERFLSYDNTVKELLTISRPVIATDIDLPRKIIKSDFVKFFAENPQYRPLCEKSFDRLETMLITRSQPEITHAISVHRHYPHGKPWTLRDVRVLELLHPPLTHTIKTVFLNEELAKYRSISTVLANVSTAIAVVSPDMRIIFGNEAFKELIPFRDGQRLPKDLGDLIMKEIDRYEPPYTTDDSIIEIPFYRFEQETYRLSVTPLSGRGFEEDKCYLVRMKPAVEPYSKMNILMQEAGLTHREIEVACLVRDGFNDREIAGRLFISLTTAKNHVKNIYKKMDVHTRAKLVALLNQ